MCPVQIVVYPSDPRLDYSIISCEVLTINTIISHVFLGLLHLCTIKKSQTRHRVKRLYRRQLAVPLVGNDEVLAEVREAFPDDGALLADACQGHAKASEMVRAKAVA